MVASYDCILLLDPDNITNINLDLKSLPRALYPTKTAQSCLNEATFAAGHTGMLGKVWTYAVKTQAENAFIMFTFVSRS